MMAARASCGQRRFPARCSGKCVALCSGPFACLAMVAVPDVVVEVEPAGGLGSLKPSIGSNAEAMGAATCAAFILGDDPLKLPPMPNFNDPAMVQETANKAQAIVEGVVGEGGSINPKDTNFSADELFFRTILLAHGHLKAHSKEQKTFQRRFTAELALNAEMKANYDKCCGNYEAQRKFKKEFAAIKHSEAEKARIQKEVSVNLAEVDGEYATFSRILAREGGDQPAYKTTCTWVAQAVALYKKGDTFGGHAWLKYDPMRGCATVLHYRDTVKMSNGQSNEIRVFDAVASAAASSSSGGVGDPTPSVAVPASVAVPPSVATPRVQTPQGAGTPANAGGKALKDKLNEGGKKGGGKGNAKKGAKRTKEGGEAPEDGEPNAKKAQPLLNYQP